MTTWASGIQGTCQIEFVFVFFVFLRVYMDVYNFTNVSSGVASPSLYIG